MKTTTMRAQLMIKKSVVATMVVFFMFLSAASAQAYDLPLAGTTPASPLFFLERFFENVVTFFTFGEANKTYRYLALAEERLDEALVLAEQQDDENTTKATQLYEKQLAQAKEHARRTGRLDLEAQVTNATTRHLVALDQVLERVPKQAREQVKAAKERTIAGQLASLRGIAQRDPKRAASIFAAAAEGRLQAAQTRAEYGGDDEKEVREVEEALGEYEKYAQFGGEILRIAQRLGTGETKVRTLIGQATKQHLQVLQDVKAKVPLPAQDAIERAIRNAKRVKQPLPTDIPGRINQSAGEQGSNNEQDETRSGAPQGTPSAGFRPQSAGGNKGAKQQESASPTDIPSGRP